MGAGFTNIAISKDGDTMWTSLLRACNDNLKHRLRPPRNIVDKGIKKRKKIEWKYKIRLPLTMLERTPRGQSWAYNFVRSLASGVAYSVCQAAWGNEKLGTA